MARPPAHRVAGAEVFVRPATRADVEAIHTVLDPWVESGAILRREAAEIEAAVESFAVACELDDDGDRREHVVACAALVVYSSRLAEIRSVASSPDRRRRGAASAVIDYLTDWAERLEIERVFLLTKSPEFFARCGYAAVDPRALPDSFLLDHVHAQGRSAAGKRVMIRDFAAEY
ncbi:MAG: GNAT family N-acetyltransferase [Planctomycetota bacterium]